MTDEQQPQLNQEVPQLTISDLTALANLIQAACSRGAYKAEEMSVVGGAYDKLVKFLTHASQPKQ